MQLSPNRLYQKRKHGRGPTLVSSAHLSDMKEFSQRQGTVANRYDQFARYLRFEPKPCMITLTVIPRNHRGAL